MNRRMWASASVVLIGALVVPAAGSAAASSARCRVTGATVVHGELIKQTGFPMHDSSVVLKRGDSLLQARAYRADEPTTIRWFKNTATVTSGSLIGMTCFGLAVGDKPNKPALSIMEGKATVHARGTRPLGIVTITALVGAAPEQLGDRLNFVAGEHHSDTKPSTTHVVVLKGTPWINITPYVGPEPGTCRHAISATLKANGPRGSATYKLAS